MTDLEVFQEEFTIWQKLLGLTGYKVYFTYRPIGDSFADITITQADMVATARLNSKIPAEAKLDFNIKACARHEAIHLLLGRIENRAIDRYVSEAEIFEATEEAVRRLESALDQLDALREQQA